MYLMAVITLAACNDSKKSMPAAPASADVASASLKGKKYKTARVGLLSPFKMDAENPYQWFDEMKDTSSFFTSYRDERMQLQLHFSNDTTATIMDSGKTIPATYHVDDTPEDDEKPGIRIRMSYEDNSMSPFPGQTGPMVLTVTYRIIGVDDKQLLVETPNGFNQRKVVALLQAE